MRFRNETTRHDRSFNLACQILANSALGELRVSKRSLRLQIRDRMEMSPLDLKSEAWYGDFRATGDAANTLGIRKYWQGNDAWLSISAPVIECCKDYLEASGQEPVDLFDREFMVERKVSTSMGQCKLRLTRLEDGLVAGSLIYGSNETHFFAGAKIEKLGSPVSDGLIREALKTHNAHVVSNNPTASPLTEKAAKYVSQMIRKEHIKYPYIRSRKFLVRATVANIGRASQRDQADMLSFVDQLNLLAEAWTVVNGYLEPETFRQFIKRSFNS